MSLQTLFCHSEGVARGICFTLILTLSPPALAQSWQSNLNQGDHDFQQGKFTQAENNYHLALEEVENTGGVNLAYVLNRLATIHRRQKHWQQALDESQKALTIWQRERGGASVESGRTLTDMAEECLHLGLPADTENYLRQALVIATRPVNTATQGSQFRGRNQFVNQLLSDPATIPGSPDAVRVLNGWVEYYLSGNHFAEAESLQKRSVEMLRQMENGYDNAIIYSPPEDFLPWGGSPDLPDALLRLGDIYVLQGRFDLGEPEFREAISILESALGPSNTRTVEAKARLSKDLKEAEQGD